MLITIFTRVAPCMYAYDSCTSQLLGYNAFRVRAVVGPCPINSPELCIERRASLRIPMRYIFGYLDRDYLLILKHQPQNYLKILKLMFSQYYIHGEYV